MIVDCDRCKVRGNACQDCVITLLLGAPPVGVELDGGEQRALDALAEAGMVPRLQLVDRNGRRGPVLAPTGALAVSGLQLAVSGLHGLCADRDG
jgi:hypothetical protein